MLKENNNLKIGDRYTIESDENLDEYLKNKTFKIVGFVQSPMYIDNMSRGNTNVGKGSIDYFAILNNSDIVMDVYTEIYVRFKNVETLGAYSDEYKIKMEENNKYLENLYSNRVIERIEEVKLDAQKEFDKAYKEIEDGEKKLDSAQKEIDNGKRQLNEGKRQYEQALKEFKNEIENGEKNLAKGQVNLEKAQNELDKQKEQILAGENQLKLVKKQLDNVKQEFLKQGIDPTESTRGYEIQIESLNTLYSIYNGLSNDINKTVEDIKEGNEIPNKKIQYWKSIILTSNLGLSNLSDLVNKRVIERIEEVKLDAQKEFDKAYKEIEDGEKKLDSAQNEIDNGKRQLNEGKRQYEQALKEYKNEIENGEKNLAKGQVNLENAQKELDKQKEQVLDGENQLKLVKKQLDNVKQEFLSQGIDPTESTQRYEVQIEDLNTLYSTYNGLSNDINQTVEDIKEGNEIPNKKIQYWKSIILTSNLGLSNLSDLVNKLEKNPTNTSLALNISNEIENSSNILSENKFKLETLVTGITNYQQGINTYEEQVKKFNEGKIQLDEAQKQLEQGKEQILKGKKELEEGKQKGQLELDKAKFKLVTSEKKLLDGEKQIDENRQKLLDGLKDIEKEKLNDLDDSEYYFFDRTDNPGYSTYKGSIESLDKIASVFPVFFFLVAALICLTTMTRMVEENRIEIGTLKALGYKDLEISKKFVIYAALASICGSVIGILVGSTILPYIINIAYSSTFTLPEVKINYYTSYIIQSIIASILCTVGAAVIVLKEELRDNPSNLMRAKAPKLGKKILLERITPLWKRLNFNQKVTFRNLFRYKQRMLMTILGISGCMAMLVAGISLEKSNSSFMDIQFEKLLKYDAIVVFKDKATKKENEEYDKNLKELKEYGSSLNIYQESVTFSKEGVSKQIATMYIPENINDLNQYILLNGRVSEEKYHLSDNGAIINEKLARLLDVSKGDNITLTDSNNNLYKVKVDNIAENYTGHYIYLSPTYYKKIFKSDVVYNAQLLKFNSDKVDENKIASNLMKNDKVVNITLASKIRSLSESADLGLVMIVIIVASGSLAFVVLYNLININVSERIREISTIKVLGFYDNEVAMYIFRENIILTMLGILMGSIMGKILYVFLVSTAEMDNMMMIPTVSISSYVLSGLITMLFAVLVMIMMSIKLKNVNMIDALKSIE